MTTKTATIPGSPSQRNPSLDLIKVFAMMYVIFGWHMDDYANNILATGVGRTLVIGALGMFVFVSGFTLTRSCGEITTAADVWHFIKKRLVRIYPLYLSSLLLFLITSEITSKQFFSGLFLLNAILNVQIKTLWFVTMIFLFYLLLPLVIYRFSVKRVLVVSFFFLAATIALHNSTGLMDLRLAYYFPLFVLGIFCARSESLFQHVKSYPVAIISVLVLVLMTFLFAHIGKPWFKYYYIPSCLIFSVSPLALLAERCVILVNMELVKKLSYVSFGMYLYHRFIFWTLMKIYRPETDIMLVGYLFLFGFPLLYLLSKIIQSGYDFMLEKLNQTTMNNRQDAQEAFNG